MRFKPQAVRVAREALAGGEAAHGSLSHGRVSIFGIFLCIPESNRHLEGIRRVNEDLMRFSYRENRQEVATLDMDTTLVEIQKAGAFFD